LTIGIKIPVAKSATVISICPLFLPQMKMPT
jgi:hypothetical protein